MSLSWPPDHWGHQPVSFHNKSSKTVDQAKGGAGPKAAVMAASESVEELPLKLIIDANAGAPSVQLAADTRASFKPSSHTVVDAYEDAQAAAESGHESIIKLLIDRGADMNTGATRALVAASKGGRESIINLLIDRGADMKTGATRALVAASKGGHESIVQLLIDHGADVNAGGRRALVAASEGGHESVAYGQHQQAGMRALFKLLVDRGAGLNAGALMAASAGGHESVVRLLIHYGADVNAGAPRALVAASQVGHESIVRLLIDHGADVNADAAYALVAASKGGHESIVQLLIDRGADVNADAVHAPRALVAASKGGHESIVQLLIDRGADVNADAVHAPRALVAASKGGHESIVQLLIDHGADVNAGGPCALAAASADGHKSIVQLLIDHGADVNAGGPRALAAASAGGHKSIVQLLIDHGADVNADAAYALEAASRSGHESIVQLLIDHGADVNATATHALVAASEGAEPSDISTFVICSPKSTQYQAPNTASFSPEDIQRLKSEYADGGSATVVYRPEPAVLWLQMHHDHPLIEAIQSRNVGGPIAAMLAPDSPCLVIFGSIHDGWVLKAAKLLADESQFTVMSYEIAYEAAEDLNRKGSKYPLEVEFSVGIHVVDRDLINDRTSTVPEIPDLPETSFLIMNQINLWINSDHKAERQGILVLTVAHIPDIHTDDRVAILESQEVKLAKGSFIPVPTDTQPALYQGKMSVSAVVQPQRAEPKQTRTHEEIF
ncbi:ankyrin repeat-containing domain protein [Mycena alexandri]|uniref:Ankyrin repeat-containing domain protein n=1 Tax=Mycena alexandri TaxID=1745969 RepID=A0AAD6S2E5_9AGAR|nr:ankyrin repeat-containing domain protein [Mycena alexandri]